MVVKLRLRVWSGALVANVDGGTVLVMPGFRWYQTIWLGVPLLLIVPILAGGALGGLLGVGAYFVNLKVFRVGRGKLYRYGVTALVSMTAVVAYFVVVAFALTFLPGFTPADAIDHFNRAVDLQDEGRFVEAIA